MKKILRIATLCLATIVSQSFCVTAQINSPSTIHRNSKTGFDRLMPCRNPRSAAKTTGDNAARVIALANLKYDGTSYVPTDSSSLVYGGGRGSYYSQNGFSAVNYDVAISYEFAGATVNNYLKHNQTFDANNNVQTFTEQAWISWIANWRNDYQEVNTFDGMHNMLTNTAQGWDTAASVWVNSNRTTNTYTAANKLATSIWENWNTTAGAWENSFRATQGYDVSNFPINSVSEVWNMTTSTWDSAYRVVYMTDVFGNITQETAQSYDMTFHGWLNVSRYTYTYDASGRLLTDIYEIWDFPTATWQNSSKSIYSGYVGSNAATIVYQSWDGGISAFVNNNRDNYTFNSFDQPTFVYNETWDASGNNWILVANSNFAERYTYETYISDLPVISRIIGIASVYPVPAKDAVSVNVTWNEPQAFTIVITDMLGRIVMTREVTDTANYSAILPVSNLSSGNYIIKMEGANGKLIRRLVIEK